MRHLVHAELIFSTDRRKIEWPTSSLVSKTQPIGVAQHGLAVTGDQCQCLSSVWSVSMHTPALTALMQKHSANHAVEM